MTKSTSPPLANKRRAPSRRSSESRGSAPKAQVPESRQAPALAELRLRLDPASFTPFYQQIVDQVKAQVRSQMLKENDPFFSERDVAEHLGISKMPVRQAFQKLRAEGLLVIEKGKVPRVGLHRVPWNFQQLRGFSEEMRRRGLEPSAKLLNIDIIPAPPEIAQALQLDELAPIYDLLRLRLVNGEPVAIVHSHLPARDFPGLEQHAARCNSLYQLYEETYARLLSHASEEIGATVADKEAARLLKTSIGKPLLFIRETTYDSRNRPIEYSESRLRADRYSASVVSLRRPQG